MVRRKHFLTFLWMKHWFFYVSYLVVSQSWVTICSSDICTSDPHSIRGQCDQSAAPIRLRSHAEEIDGRNDKHRMETDTDRWQHYPDTQGTSCLYGDWIIIVPEFCNFLTFLPVLLFCSLVKIAFLSFGIDYSYKYTVLSWVITYFVQSPIKPVIFLRYR